MDIETAAKEIEELERAHKLTKDASTKARLSNKISALKRSIVDEQNKTEIRSYTQKNIPVVADHVSTRKSRSGMPITENNGKFVMSI